MLRALYAFLIVAALSGIAIWLADNPGIGVATRYVQVS